MRQEHILPYSQEITENIIRSIIYNAKICWYVNIIYALNK